MKDQITVMFPVNRLAVGGAEQQLLELVKGLDKRRFKPIVATLYPGGALEPEVRAVPSAELICLHRRHKYDFSTLLHVSRLLREEQVDIIQPFLTPATFFGMLPALMNHTPVKIVTERAGVWVDSHFGYDLYLKTEDCLSRFADWVVPNSESGRSYLIKRGINPARIRVIYNGINLKRLAADPNKVAEIRSRMGVPPDGMVMGITASLTPAKDHATFIQAARLVLQEMPQSRFAILGDGPLRPSLEALVKELGLAPYITFYGIQRDVGSYISAFDIACLSSRDHEGCSNATLEAMALGKPVVATDIGGNRELVDSGQTGLLVPVGNPPALAMAILECIRRPDWARQIGRRAQEMVNTRFSMSRMVQDYQALYEESLRAKEKAGSLPVSAAT